MSENPIKTLREQLWDIARRRSHNPHLHHGRLLMIVPLLAQQAFVEDWPKGDDTAAIRRGMKLLEWPGYIPSDEPAIFTNKELAEIFKKEI